MFVLNPRIDGLISGSQCLFTGHRSLVNKLLLGAKDSFVPELTFLSCLSLDGSSDVEWERIRQEVSP